MNSAARLVFSSSRYDHVTLLLRQLHVHWLKATERIDYKLALLVYTCRQGVAPSYLADELCQPADTEARRRLRSASHTRLSTVGDRAFLKGRRANWIPVKQRVEHIRCSPRALTVVPGCGPSAGFNNTTSLAIGRPTS